MAFNPNAVFVSPSSLADLEKCPQAYYYRYVYRTPRNLKLQIISPALSLGTVIHDTIDQFLAMDLSDRKPEELDRVYNYLWDNFSGDKGGFTSVDEEKETKERGIIMLNRFKSNPDFWTTSAKAKFPDFPKVDLGPDLILTGKLDWIDQTPDGGYRIIDFKTGKNKEREDSYQLPIYSILVKNLMKTDKLTAYYWYLDSSDQLESVGLPDYDSAFAQIRQKGEVMQMVRKTQSYRCQSGKESCWACKEIKAVAEGGGKLVKIDPSHNQEIYILPKTSPEPAEIPVAPDLPF